MATWLRDHLDHHLPILLSRTGPFAQCSEDEHIQPRQPRAEQPPPHWWDTGGAVVHGGAAVPTAPEGPAEPEIAHEPGE